MCLPCQLFGVCTESKHYPSANHRRMCRLGSTASTECCWWPGGSQTCLQTWKSLKVYLVPLEFVAIIFSHATCIFMLMEAIMICIDSLDPYRLTCSAFLSFLSTVSTCGTSAKDRISAESERLSLPVWSQRNPVRNGHNWEIRTDTFMASENVATPSLESIFQDWTRGNEP